jgi:8-oxo-dGTP pyrophosphatase MutT (NUDIX family)
MLLFLTVLKKSKTPKRPNLAATVILAREHKEDLQTYLIKRSPMSGFMAGNYVFPGGIINSEDRYTEVWKAHVDLDLNWISQRLGGDISGEEVLANSVAAVRETFEEVGVLLAHRDKPVEKVLDRICEMRLASHLLKGWFLEQVVSEGWILEFSRLAGWSHWITPPLVRSRFDTRFFVAFMPEG